jgi:hypothetical protein
VESDMFKLKNKLIECEEYISSLKTGFKKYNISRQWKITLA